MAKKRPDDTPVSTVSDSIVQPTPLLLQQGRFALGCFASPECESKEGKCRFPRIENRHIRG